MIFFNLYVCKYNKISNTVIVKYLNMEPDPIWAPTSIEIKTLAQPDLFTVWLYNQALKREHKAKELTELTELKYNQELEKQKLMEKQLMVSQLMAKQKLIESQLMLKKIAPMKPILINQSYKLKTKPKTETRINNDGSICKFLY